jgi:hypothetical protein
VSPRIGINWDVKGDRSTQIRGGTGVLTGRVPFVWLSNAVSNNGLYFGQFNSTSVPLDNTGDGFPYNFSPTPYKGSAESYSNLHTGTPTLITNPLDRNYGRSAIVPAVNTVAKNFRFPQVWRTNVAVDQALPWDMVGTLEFIYTKDINAVFIRDANIAAPVGTLAGDGRPLYGTAPSNPNTDRAIISNDRRVNGDLGQALVIDNTKKGYQWSITAQLQKTFNKNFMVSLAYTYTDAREMNPSNGSTAGGILSSQANVLGVNNPGLGFASALTPHRIIAYGSYHIEYFKNFGTTFGFTYEGRSGANFSYTYNGDPNSDGSSGSDLIYIPRSKDEIVLTTASATDNRTVDEIWTQLDNFIKQDKYLNSRRGKYAERSGAYAPWVNRLNFSLLQDFYLNVNGKRHTLQISANLENALNLFNSSWGLLKNPVKGINNSQLIRFLGYETPNAAGTVGANGQVTTTTPTTGRPVYTFETNADGSVVNKSFIPDQTVSGRWQLQLGARYIF